MGWAPVARSSTPARPLQWVGARPHCRQLADAVGALISSEGPETGLARAGISLVAAISRQATNRVQTRGLRARVAASRESAAVTRPTVASRRGRMGFDRIGDRSAPPRREGADLACCRASTQDLRL